MSMFGEIVEPTSRTVWEEWDDGEGFSSNDNFPLLEWEKDVSDPEEIDTLFIFEGKYLLECLKMQSQYSLEFINGIPKITLNLYKVKGSHSYVCIINEYSLLQCSEIVELLKNYVVNSKDVVCIQVKPHVDYHEICKTDENCIIRSISTLKYFSKDQACMYPKLEQPNIISGVTAGVISLREHLELPGTALVCYMEYSDEFQIGEIKKLLKKLQILQDIESRPSDLSNSNLYI